MTQQYYLHFETKPPFEVLDRFFEKCLAYQPIFATSYFVEIDRSVLHETVREFAQECFQRYAFVLVRAVQNMTSVIRESDYITVGIESPHR